MCHLNGAIKEPALYTSSEMINMSITKEVKNSFNDNWGLSTRNLKKVRVDMDTNLLLE